MGTNEEMSCPDFWTGLLPKILKEQESPGEFIITNDKEQRAVDFAYSTILRSSYDIGGDMHRIIKLQDEALARGRMYRPDSAASSLTRFVAHTFLKKAIVAVCSQNQAVRRASGTLI